MDQSTTDLISSIAKLAINELSKAVEKGIRELGKEETREAGIDERIKVIPQEGDLIICTGSRRGDVFRWDGGNICILNMIRPVILKTNAEIEAILRENQ
ncbi:MAG: hypothetical protein PHX80_03780 [Candidatus Nanoarchaeia archaeon]|nr:hypothetical protein [Candidatus Nanoarchaeia archaeon]